MEYILLISFACIIIYEYKKKKAWSNTLLFTLFPYAVIIFLNNIIFSHFGYYRVENRVIILVLLSIIPLYAGIFFRRSCIRNYNSICRGGALLRKDDAVDFSERNIKYIVIWFVLCCIIRILQLYTIYRKYGIAVIGQSDFSEFGLQGLPSHLFLTLFPLAAILFYYGITKKKVVPLLLYVLGMFVAVASAIKYHAILYILFTYIYCVLKDSGLARKLLLVVIGGILFLFIGNYVVSFALRGISGYETSDYLVKLWDYIGGSMINGNVAVDEFGKTSYKVTDFLFSSLTPFLNMFTARLFGISLHRVSLPLGFRYISAMNSKSNVMGLIFNVLYTGSILFFILFLFLLGLFVENMIIKIDTRKDDNKLIFYSMFLAIIILTFFANYFELSTIWELLILSYMIPWLFCRKRIKFII